jgi:hypothetical protein
MFKVGVVRTDDLPASQRDAMTEDRLDLNFTMCLYHVYTQNKKSSQKLI